MTPKTPSWRAPLYLLALAALPFLLPYSTDATTLTARLLDGDCEALPVLAQHHPEALTTELLQTLATHSDPRLRELTLHQAWIPHIPIHAQLEIARTLEPPELRQRAHLWLSRRTTSLKSLTLKDIESYWTSRDPR